jgi:SDR family mycofactocin-dependent oxidoreductase
MGLLEGKVALVTGAARGQGRAHAVVSASEGADVVLLDVATELPGVPYPGASEEDLDETVRLVEAQGRKALRVVADVRDQAALDAAVARAITELGRIDILVANAGIYSAGPFWELTDAQWDDMIGVCLTGVWRSAKAVAPHMVEQQSGSIVAISSMNGLRAGPNYSHYTAAKHGVIGLMTSMAADLAPHGVRCNAIAPGAINTPMVNYPAGWAIFAGKTDASEEEVLDSARHYNSLKGVSLIPPEEVAKTALYLNSDLARNVTGVTVPVDAGHLLLMGRNLNPVK